MFRSVGILQIGRLDHGLAVSRSAFCALQAQGGTSLRQSLDPRYELMDALSAGGGRRVLRARDRLTGRPVVCKTAPLSEVCSELHCLLSLPPGLGPEVHDVIWAGRGRLWIAQEELKGESLREAAARLPSERVPALAQAICQALVHLHRSGWVHTDLKPDNLRVFCTDEEISVRLLDFGFAFDQFGGASAQPVGGTPPYWAPELRLAFVVDARADLYSLGVMLRELLPAEQRDARWEPILSRLCQEIPARRYPDSAALRNDLEARFSLPPGPDRLPRLWSGPLLGRTEVMERLTRQTLRRPRSRVLVQARPGVGLTRFLLETVLAAAEEGCAPLRVVDFSALRTDDEFARAVEFIHAPASRFAARSTRRDESASILGGVEDPSPALRWIPESRRRRLLSLLGSGGWNRLTLPPIDETSFCGVVQHSLGTSSPEVREMAERLYLETDGDLRMAAEVTQGALLELVQKDEVAYTIGSEDLARAIESLPRRPVVPRFSELTPDESEALRICALAGLDFPADLAEGLVRQFCSRCAAVDRLVESGLLGKTEAGLLRFMSRPLWKSAEAEPPESSAEINQWLVEHDFPDLSNLPHVLRTCRRARRLEMFSVETSRLREALDRICQDWAKSKILSLLAYPDEAEPRWTVEELRRRAADLARIVGPPWTEERLVVFANYTAWTPDQDLQNRLLREASESADPETAGPALCRLIRSRDPEEKNLLAKLRELEGTCSAIPAGTSLSFSAMCEHQAGESSLAARLALEAADQLQGTGSEFEFMARQLVAVTHMEDPLAAIPLFRNALEQARGAERAAQVRANICSAYWMAGELETAVRTADEALLELPGWVPRSVLIRAGLIVHRAGIRRDLGEFETAMRDCRMFLAASPAHTGRFYVTARQVIAECHLRRGANGPAIRECFRAFVESTGLFGRVRWNLVQTLIDILVDVGSMEFLDEFGAGLHLEPEGDEPEVVTTAARLEALCAQRAGQLDQALAALEQCRAIGGALSDVTVRARYLHHLGMVHLARIPARGVEAARAAADLFQEQLDGLPSRHFDYERAQALKGLGLALAGSGKADDAIDALDRAISLAKAFRFQRVLADCLEARARVGLESPENQPGAGDQPARPGARRDRQHGSGQDSR